MNSTTQVFQLYIRATAEAIWEAITQPEFTAKYYFGSRVQTTLRAGEPFVYTAADGSLLCEGEVIESAPPRKLVQTWHGVWGPEVAADPVSRVTWDVEPQDGGFCKLTVTHDRLESAKATRESVSSGWTLVLSGMKTLLETGKPLAAG